MKITFEVLGEPATQGSKKEVAIRNKKGPIVKEGRVMTRIVEDNPRLPQWRQAVAQVAREAYGGRLLIGAIVLRLTFIRPRPKGHYGTGRNAGTLKPSALPYPITRPDTLKLARAVEDALTQVLWVDDSQVVRHEVTKAWGDYFCVRVSVTSLDGLTREE